MQIKFGPSLCKNLDVSECALTRADPELISRHIYIQTHTRGESKPSMGFAPFQNELEKLAWAGVGSYRVRTKPN